MADRVARRGRHLQAADAVTHVTTFSGFCILYGYSVPLSEDTLQSLYRSHRDYVSQVAGESGRLVREGFWLHPDAVEVVNRAAQSAVP
jgi:Alpha/beta hydrolase domain